MSSVVLKIIRLYQKTISPDHGFFCKLWPHAGCRYYPSCSEYTYQSIDQKGLTNGVLMGFRRLLKCHPWSLGGYDPVKK